MPAGQDEAGEDEERVAACAVYCSSQLVGGAVETRMDVQEAGLASARSDEDERERVGERTAKVGCEMRRAGWRSAVRADRQVQLMVGASGGRGRRRLSGGRLTLCASELSAFSPRPDPAHSQLRLCDCSYRRLRLTGPRSPWSPRPARLPVSRSPSELITFGSLPLSAACGARPDACAEL